MSGALRFAVGPQHPLVAPRCSFPARHKAPFKFLQEICELCCLTLFKKTK